MSYIHHDRNNEQMLVPITVIRGGTSRGFYFEEKNVPKPGEGLEQVAIVSPSSRPDADVDYTFIQMFPQCPDGPDVQDELRQHLGRGPGFRADEEHGARREGRPQHDPGLLH